MGKESRIQRAICQKMDKAGWLVLKLGIVSIAGFPDLLAMKSPGDVVFIEVKRPGKAPTNLQMYWLNRLLDMGFHARWCDQASQIDDLI